MSSFPKWWDTTITIYNKYEDKETSEITWYRTVVSKCFWKHISEKVVVGNQLVETANVICRIPKNPNFVEKFLWIMSNKRKFTLGVQDIIVKGEVTDVIDEYTKGSRSSDLIAKYKLQGCIVINDVTIDADFGKGLKHYLVKGI